MGFTEDEFHNALKELEEPNIEGYEFFVESNGVKLYRLYSEKSGLYQYKVFGNIAVDAEVCADVYMDLKYRKVWDSYATELYHISEEDMELVYWEVAYPWPMSNRDYVYTRQKKIFETSSGNKAYIVLGRSSTPDELQSKSVAEKSGVIRVEDFTQGIAITSDGKGGTRAFMHYYDDPKGSIPSWLINWAASKGVPDFLSTMEEACKNYNSYKMSRSS